jgi:hypothetical protein
MQISRSQFFRTIGDALNAMIVEQRSDYERAVAEARHKSGRSSVNLPVARSPDDPKKRWVDGTPEYSLSVYELRMLFPDARLIHILRDVRAVVPSLMNFSKLAGYDLVKNEEEAYRYWLRTVRGCIAGERAFGSHVVQRVRYRDLLAAPEETLRKCLRFLSEEYSPDCLIPLASKINSSNVPDDFDSTDLGTPSALRQEAHQLSDLLDSEEPAFPGSADAVAELEEQFLKHAHYIAWAPAELERRLRAERAKGSTLGRA